MIAHLFNIAVVCCDQAMAVCGLNGVCYAQQTIVDTLHCLDGGAEIAGVTHHVAVGVIADDDIEFSGFNGFFEGGTLSVGPTLWCELKMLRMLRHVEKMENNIQVHKNFIIRTQKCLNMNER